MSCCFLLIYELTDICLSLLRRICGCNVLKAGLKSTNSSLAVSGVEKIKCIMVSIASSVLRWRWWVCRESMRIFSAVHPHYLVKTLGFLSSTDFFSSSWTRFSDFCAPFIFNWRASSDSCSAGGNTHLELHAVTISTSSTKQLPQYAVTVLSKRCSSAIICP